METFINNLESVLHKAEAYAETKLEIAKLNTAGKTAETISSILSAVAFVSLSAMAIGILSIGVAIWIGALKKQMQYGFFIVGGFYALVALLVYVFRKKLIKKPLANLIIDRLIK
jgi:uncharacterized membrane protein